MKKQVVVFMGTRPEAIKMASVITELRKHPKLDCKVISTGQHREMLRQVTEQFHISVDADLDVMRPNQTLASLSARLIESIDASLGELKPDMALVQGDTTTVLMAALACFYRQIPLGHVEAGLRTGNMLSPFPEEANRKLAASLVTLHFAPTEGSRDALLREHIDPSTITVTGNTVIDALMIETERQKELAIKAEIDVVLAGLVAPDWADIPYVLITGHRRENFGKGIAQICDAIRTLAAEFTDHRFIYPVHLNPNVQVEVNKRLTRLSNVFLIPPQDYRRFIALMSHCRLVLTDSGGVQEEAPSLGKPVLVMRDTSERLAGVTAGTAVLIGPYAANIIEYTRRLLRDTAYYESMANTQNPYGDGHAAERIVADICRHLGI